jgi:hypothetical protein
MAPTKKSEPPPPAIQDSSLCHYCHKNRLDPNDKYFLPNGIEVCKECAERHGSATARRHARLRQVKKVKR